MLSLTARLVNSNFWVRGPPSYYVHNNDIILLGSTKFTGKSKHITLLQIYHKKWTHHKLAKISNREAELFIKSLINKLLIGFQSEGLAWAIYNSGLWMNGMIQSSQMKTDILIITQRCLKPEIIQVNGLFSALSFKTCVNVCTKKLYSNDTSTLRRLDTDHGRE